MDNSTNRLYPQTLVTTSHTQSTRHIPPPQKLTLRRRCRSECLQMAPTQPITGTPTDPKIFDDFSGLRRKVAQPVFRNMLLKYSPSPALHQDCAKNIFSFIETRSRTGAALLKYSTKENISKSAAVLGQSNNNGDITDYRDFSTKELKLHRERPVKVNQQDCQHDCKLHAEKCVFDYPILDINNGKSTTIIDNNKRRIRARSESESNDVYQTKQFAANQIDKNRNNGGHDFVLKRSRDDKPLNRNVQKANVLTEFDSTAKSKHSLNHQTTKTSVGTHLPRPCTPRYPIKTLNGTRKIKSRSSFIKTCKQQQNNKSMVISNPPRCPTPSSPSLVDSNKTTVEDEDDTGCSSLEDDDDLDDSSRNDEVHDSLSDSEDSFQTQSTTASDKRATVAFTLTTTDSVVGGYSTAAPLCPSLFPHVPPYITFASHTEKGPLMPAAVTKVLKWKLTTITPIVIRKVLLNSGFRLLRMDDDNSANVSDDDETNDWMGIWGKHMKSPCFKTIRSYQKINHIPGSFQIGRKDRIWRNLQVQVARYGKKEFGFMPRTYIIPNDLKLLRKIWTKYSQRNVKWIIKPPASARGAGIKVVNRWSQIPKRKPLIVQRYVERPLLINGSKFDLRLYVLITSINPLRVYMHTDGLARFASVKYSERSDTLHDRYMHLTNYSINKLSSNYAKNEDANACKGHKWTVKSLWTHLASQGVDVNSLWGALRNLVLKTILAGENTINQLSKINIGSKYNCYELFGIDVLLDSELIPWLLEVNISPSLHSASPLDLHVKGPLVQALLNTALFQVPPRIPIGQQHEIMAELGLNGPLCFDKRIFVTNLSKNERIKHSQFTQKSLANREDYLDEILVNLTPDDVRCLLTTEDELSRSAPLERIFPSSTSYKYLRFYDNPRYYNRLLDAWEYQYSDKREQGIQLLRKLCDTKIHLSVTPPPVKKDCENNTSTIDKATTAAATTISETETHQLPDEPNNDNNHPNADTNNVDLHSCALVETSAKTNQELESSLLISPAMHPPQPPPPPPACDPIPISTMSHLLLEKIESSIFSCNGHASPNGIISNRVQ